ncbi:uncharacterized protein [Solanum lycopersicum]|uniref:uncharacterized protein n=1 Tax=Solanum lycopersicum TaxID=4081 RepID=UPI003748E5B9
MNTRRTATRRLDEVIADAGAPPEGNQVPLLQKVANEDQTLYNKVIAYASRQLKVHEKNYLTHYLELAAVRSLELLKDYDMSFLYLPDKANVVVDALRHLSMGSVSHVEETKRNIVRDVHRFAHLGVRIEDSPNSSVVVNHNIESSLVVEDGFKKDIAVFVSKCPNWKQVKAEHLNPGGLLQEIQVPTWKWEDVNMYLSTYSAKDYARIYTDKIVNLRGFLRPSNRIELCVVRGVDLLEWFEVGVSLLLGPDLIYKTVEEVHIIRNWLKTTYYRQKSYADHRRRDLEFKEGDKVYSKISPMKEVVKFGMKGKLSPFYVIPYEIWQRVAKVPYELKIPSELSSIHPVFYVSMPKKCIGNSESILPRGGLSVKVNLSYEEVLVEILDRQVKWFRNKEMASEKVLWRNHLVEGPIWETKTDMKSRYLHLFPNEG